MSLAGALFHVGDVSGIGVPTRVGGVWAAYWASWRVSCPWPGSWSTPYRSRATYGVAERRRTPRELRTWAGRQKRRRRTVLAGWDRQARQRARERGRSVPGETAR